MYLKLSHNFKTLMHNFGNIDPVILFSKSRIPFGYPSVFRSTLDSVPVSVATILVARSNGKSVAYTHNAILGDGPQVCEDVGTPDKIIATRAHRRAGVFTILATRNKRNLSQGPSHDPAN